MHSDDTHKKEGFFSKIFGHHDGAQAQSDDANVIHPQDAVTVGVGDTSSDASAAPSLDPIDFAAKHDDATDATAGVDETLQLHEVSSDPVKEHSESTSSGQDDAASATASLDAPADEFKGSVADVLAVPKEGAAPLDLSHHDSALSDTDDKTEKNPFDTAVRDEHIDSQEQSGGSTGIADMGSSIGNPTDTSGGAVSNDAQDAPDMPTSETLSTSADVESVKDAVPSGSDKVTDTPAVDVEPPAPPVEEGLAWKATQATGTTQPDMSPETDPVEPSVGESHAGQAALTSAQDQVDQIFATHPDFTTGHEVEKDLVSHTEDTASATSVGTDTIMPAVTEANPDQKSPEVQAAVARLEQHIDDLETGLQKVRAELVALKNK